MWVSECLIVENETLTAEPTIPPWSRTLQIVIRLAALVVVGPTVSESWEDTGREARRSVIVTRVAVMNILNAGQIDPRLAIL